MVDFGRSEVTVVVGWVVLVTEEAFLTVRIGIEVSMITSVTASISSATSVASSAAVRALSSCLEKLELWNILSLSTHLRIR